MKTTIIALALSLSASAQSACFVRGAELSSNEVELAQMLCFDAVELELSTRRTGVAFVRYTVDGEARSVVVSLRTGRSLGTDRKAYTFIAESDAAGLDCDSSWTASALGTLVVNNDGSAAEVTEVSGELHYTNDNCHSDGRTVQRFNYDRR